MDNDKVNLNGGVIVFGYLVGVLGVIIFVKVFYEMECIGVKCVLVIMCIGGG